MVWYLLPLILLDQYPYYDNTMTPLCQFLKISAQSVNLRLLNSYNKGMTWNLDHSAGIAPMFE